MQKKQLKIAVWHNLPSGGGKRALYYHIRGLVERGHHVEVWCPPTADQNYLPLGEFAKEHIAPLDFEASPPKGFIRQPIYRFTEHSRLMRAMEAHSRLCAEQINAAGFDLFFGNSCLYLRAAPIARYISIPSVLYLQEPFRWLYEALPQLPWVAPEFTKRFLFSPATAAKFLEDIFRLHNARLQAREELRSVKAYDMVLANSFFSRESMLRAYGINARVCYLGVDANLFEASHEERKNIILGIGSFDRIKNIEFVLRSAAMLKDINPEVVWIGNSGDPVYFKFLVELAKELGVSFRPLQRILDHEMVTLLNQGRVLAYAPRLEPFGYAPLEANCCELPVVAVAEGGVRETVVDGVTGLLVEAEEEAMASGLRRLLENHEYAAELGRNGREMALQRWALSKSIDRLEDRFHQTLTISGGGK